MLNKFIETIEKYLEKKAIKKNHPMQDGDVKKTWASISKIKKHYTFQNNTSLDVGKKIIIFDFIKNLNINYFVFKLSKAL